MNSKTSGNFILMTSICLIIFIVLMALWPARAQGIYMGRDGRAHAQVIVGADGRGWPVAPTFCPGGWGPCPVILGAPIAPPLAYGAVPPRVFMPEVDIKMPAPPPLGWLFGRYTSCIEPDCRTVIVDVGADGLNVRATPAGPIVLTLANGVPVIPLQRDGDWLLVAPACPLAPTFTYSITAGGMPLSTCL